MKLFVVKSKGSYALNVAVVRAANAVEALTTANVADDPWDRHEVLELDEFIRDGETPKIVFEAGMIE